MGGLVRMGKPGYLEPVVRRAVEDAKWCSADPVCMEMGRSGGQGPDGCNPAACHNCGLVPETACEQFNRFLDSGVVIGDLHDRTLGFLKAFLEKVDLLQTAHFGFLFRERGEPGGGLSTYCPDHSFREPL